MICALRGATTVESDCREEIEKKSVELISELIKRNGVDGIAVSCVSVIVSSTSDIRSFYPARAIRESGLLAGVPLFSCLEPDIDGALPLCVRVMLTLTCDAAITFKHVYLHDAANLRPDLN